MTNDQKIEFFLRRSVNFFARMSRNSVCQIKKNDSTVVPVPVPGTGTSLTLTLKVNIIKTFEPKLEKLVFYASCPGHGPGPGRKVCRGLTLAHAQPSPRFFNSVYSIHGMQRVARMHNPPHDSSTPFIPYTGCRE